jgi:hypothetical protein
MWQVCQEAWNTMRNLMGTHLGHSALYNLCQIVQASTSATDIALIRGAVFFIGTASTLNEWAPVLVLWYGYQMYFHSRQSSRFL